MSLETIAGFAIWLSIGIFFIGSGIRCFAAKEAAGFWANAQAVPIEEIKSYNHAMGKLWGVYGILLILLGLPLLLEKDVWITASALGVVAETIGVMVVYTVKIEPKYRKKLKISEKNQKERYKS